MSLLAVFGIGQTELIVLLIIGLLVVVLPVGIVVAILAVVASNRNRDDRRQ